jgi:hypothetical protein
MDNRSERDVILAKIRKMLELADPERGGTQGEIENAARMAKMLLDKYNISMLEVMNERKSDPNLFTSREATYAVSQMKAWHWSLARAIDRIVGTRHYSTGAIGKSAKSAKTARGDTFFRLNKMCFYGMEENIKVACDLFDKWCVRIDNMAKEATRVYIQELEEEFAEEMLDQRVKQVRHLRGLGDRSPQTWRTSWLDGCVSGIHSALHDEEERQADEERKAQGKQPLSGLSYLQKREVLRMEREAEEARLAGGGEEIVKPMTTALALQTYREKVDEAYTDFSSGFRKLKSAASSRTNYGAYEKGNKVGKTIRLNSKELN